MKLSARNFQPASPSPLSAGDCPVPSLLQPPPLPTSLPSSPTIDGVPSNLLERLLTFPLFKDAPPLFHHKVAAKLKLVQYTPQEYVLKEGDPALSMYWILKGTVSVTSPDGDSIYAELTPGAFFGEIGILFNRPRTATVVARTRVLLGVLTADALNSVLRFYPLIERRIRDEAQERLSMQDKKNKAEIPILKPSNPPSTDIWPQQVTSVSIAPSTLSRPNPLPLSQIVCASRRVSISSPLVVSLDNVDQTLSIQDFIKTLPIFANLPPDLIHRLALGADPLNFKAYEYIFRKGDLGSDIYFVVDGEIEVIDDVQGKDSSERILARLKKGAYFGEMSFLELAQNGKIVKRSASIRTVTSVELIVIRSHQLERICSKYSFFVDEIRKTVLERKVMNENQNIGAQMTLPIAIPERRRSIAVETIALRESLNISRRSNRQLLSPEPSLFNPNWEGFSTFNHSSSPKPSRSISPASSVDSEFVLAKPSSLPLSEGIAENNRKRKAKCRSVSPLQQLLEGPLDLNIPPSRNYDVSSFPTSRRQSFHYMPHSKRLKIASLAGRRRSSVLVSPGSIPDKILLKVFELLDLPQLMRLRIVSRRWRQLLYMAPNIFQTLDLTPWNTTITDDALVAITDFVGSRPQHIDISCCFHITDEGFSYMVNEIGMAGNLKLIKMKSTWEVSAMAIMDLASPSVGSQLEEIDLSNCRKVNDDVIERLIGLSDETKKDLPSDDQAISVGSKKIKVLSLSYCKALTDDVMHHIANNANETLESLSLTRCTTITDIGFQHWTYRTFPRLTNLSLKDCTFLTDKAIISVANAASHLETLDLSFCCALLDTAVEVLCLGCQNLKSLDLSFCGSAVSDSSLVAISLHLRNLKTLLVKGCIRVTRAGVDALLSGFSPLTHINISQCRNAHVYPGNVPAQTLQINPSTKSAFITAGPTKDIIEIVV